MNYSCGSRLESTHRIQITSCSLFEASVHSSLIMQKNRDCFSSAAILLKIFKAITLSISFCALFDVYLLVFFESQTSILGSSKPRSFNSCMKLESTSSPSPLKERPCLDKKKTNVRQYPEKTLTVFAFLMGMLSGKHLTHIQTRRWYYYNYLQGFFVTCRCFMILKTDSGILPIFKTFSCKRWITSILCSILLDFSADTHTWQNTTSSGSLTW